MPFFPNLKKYVNLISCHNYNIIRKDRVLLLQEDSYISSHLIHWKKMGRGDTTIQEDVYIVRGVKTLLLGQPAI